MYDVLDKDKSQVSLAKENKDTAFHSHHYNGWLNILFSEEEIRYLMIFDDD